jgi:hypothetical protein
MTGGAALFSAFNFRFARFSSCDNFAFVFFFGFAALSRARRALAMSFGRGR